jgi:hypothetical protein
VLGHNHIRNFLFKGIIIAFHNFDELMIHHDVFSLLFSEIHTWTKKSIRHTWKAWRTKMMTEANSEKI